MLSVEFPFINPDANSLALASEKPCAIKMFCKPFCALSPGLKVIDFLVDLPEVLPPGLDILI